MQSKSTVVTLVYSCLSQKMKRGFSDFFFMHVWSVVAFGVKLPIVTLETQTVNANPLMA